MVKEQLCKMDIVNVKNIYYNLSPAELVEHAVRKNEVRLMDNGAINALTGKYTGRSPNDRYIVFDDVSENKVNWGKINKKISFDFYDKLYNKLTAYLQGKDIYVFDGYVGADPNYRIGLRVVNEYAFQNLASRNLFIRMEEEKADPAHDLTVICCPGFASIPSIDGTESEAFIILSLKEKTAIIGGSMYFGEIKKSIFSIMNFLMPAKNVFPMHCSANTNEKGNTALFFGLSGTGKTSLSADIERKLIGDDEHGWSNNRIFNFEGGCYAKTISLKRENEPQIYDSIKFGAVTENIVVDEKTLKPDYSNDRYTPNTRAAYPIYFIPNSVLEGIGPHPKTIFFLTADAFGVLPPVSKLTTEQAMYHFVLGYTSKLAGTERGIVMPESTFSSCFGAPFMLLHPSKYAEMLKERIEKYKTDVYLINTGWTGGEYGIGERIKIQYTRRMIKACLNREFKKIEFIKEKYFGLNIPVSCPDIDSNILNPENTWKDKQKYADKAAKLNNEFEKRIKEIGMKI